MQHIMERVSDKARKRKYLGDENSIGDGNSTATRHLRDKRLRADGTNGWHGSYPNTIKTTRAPPAVLIFV